MQLYADQLKDVATICEHLNTLPECKELFIGAVPIEDQHGDVLGYLVDEIGGAFSFVSKKEYDAHWNRK